MKVMRDWTEVIPRREQGVLVVALRGCDEAPKEPGQSIERQLVAYLRYLVLNPADQREVDWPGGFMQSGPPGHFIADKHRYDWRASLFGHYPQHWYAHLMHAFEVIGYRHPDPHTRTVGALIYGEFVRNLHLNPETFEQFEQRLSEDRIALGAVVS